MPGKDMKTEHLRQEYEKAILSEDDVGCEPFELFRKWFELALEQEELADSVVLSTVTPEGTPNARVVLLKELDEEGFSFFTNKNSPKGQELKLRPHASLLFWWPNCQRQVRIEGSVVELDEEASDAYFASRPRGAQISAWASKQSQVIDGRKELDHNMHEAEKRFEGSEVPRPKHWGGYKVLPHAVEFWQGRTNRLHDRFRYEKRLDDGWTVKRLNP